MAKLDLFEDLLEHMYGVEIVYLTDLHDDELTDDVDPGHKDRHFPTTVDLRRVYTADRETYYMYAIDEGKWGYYTLTKGEITEAEFTALENQKKPQQAMIAFLESLLEDEEEEEETTTDDNN